MKKIGFFVLALVLVLGTMGVAYAKWTDTVNLNATITTGNLILGIQDLGSNDPSFIIDQDGDPEEVISADPQCTPGNNREQKDVASLDSVNGTPKTGCPGYFQDITETFDNVYPYYSATTTIQITNCGTVPLKLDDVDGRFIVATGSTDLMCWMRFSGTITDENNKQTTFGPTSIDGLAAALLAANVQIGGGKTLTLALTVCFVETCNDDPEGQIMPQGAHASYVVTIEGAQWNEVP